jgi:hypothetical protein
MITTERRCPHCNVQLFGDNPNTDPALAAGMGHLCWKCVKPLAPVAAFIKLSYEWGGDDFQAFFPNRGEAIAYLRSMWHAANNGLVQMPEGDGDFLVYLSDDGCQLPHPRCGVRQA